MWLKGRANGVKALGEHTASRVLCGFVGAASSCDRTFSAEAHRAWKPLPHEGCCPYPSSNAIRLNSKRLSHGHHTVHRSAPRFRQRLKDFLAAEVTPHVDQWEADRIVPRDIWRRMGQEGFLCLDVAPEYGGLGEDFRYSVDCHRRNDPYLAHRAGVLAAQRHCCALYQLLRNRRTEGKISSRMCQR